MIDILEKVYLNLKRYGFSVTLEKIKIHSLKNYQIFLNKYKKSSAKILNQYKIDLEDSMYPGEGQKVAIHFHIYWIELIDEFIFYLKDIKLPLKIIITTNSLSKFKIINKKFQGYNYQIFLIKENIGRDIYPFYRIYKYLLDFDYVLHIHTKKSSYEDTLSGWRSYLFDALLKKENFYSIINTFKKKNVGILAPYPYHEIIERLDIAGNKEKIKLILKKANLDFSEFKKFLDDSKFPASSMFWFQPKSLKNLLSLKLSDAEFRHMDKSKLKDGSLAHAIERVFGFFCFKSNMKFRYFKSIHYDNFNYPFCQVPTSYLHFLVKKYKPSQLIISHTLQGGSNLYLKNLYFSTKKSFIEISLFKNGNCYIQIVNSENNTKYYTSYKELFKLLKKTKIINTTINSIIDFNSPQEFVIFLKRIKHLTNSSIHYILHDYFPICPTYHLLNYKDEYCEIPPQKKCNNCLHKLKKNKLIFYKTKNIQFWRKTFETIFDQVDQVNYFNESVYQIISRIFKNNILIKMKKVNINEDHLKLISYNISKKSKKNTFLSVASIGTLTPIKGFHKINDILLYLNNHKIKKIKYHLIGKNTLPFKTNNINIIGEYKHDKLGQIINRLNIDVIFFSSIVPETHSYVLSEIMKLNLPILCYNLGAQANRLKKYKKATLIDLKSSEEEIIIALNRIKKKFLL